MREDRRQTAQIGEDGRRERIARALAAENGAGALQNGLAREEGVDRFILARRVSASREVGPGREQRRGGGLRKPRRAQTQHQRDRKTAAGRIARQRDRAGARRAQRLIGGEDVVERRREDMLRREPVGGREDVEAGLRELARDEAKQPRRADEKPAAMQIHERSCRAAGGRRRGPFAEDSLREGSLLLRENRVETLLRGACAHHQRRKTRLHETAQQGARLARRRTAGWFSHLAGAVSGFAPAGALERKSREGSERPAARALSRQSFAAARSSSTPSPSA